MKQFSKVYHNHYGEGTVIRTSDKSVTVLFESVQVTFYDEQIKLLKEVEE